MKSLEICDGIFDLTLRNYISAKQRQVVPVTMALTSRVAAVRRLLNRATSMCLSDATFMSEFCVLAQSDPDELLAGSLKCASLAVEQAELIYGLLLRLPWMVQHGSTSVPRSHLLHLLRGMLDQELPIPRQRALLLFMARLTQQIEHPLNDIQDARDGQPLVSRDLLLSVVLVPLLRQDTAQITRAPKGSVVLEAVLQVLSGRSAQPTAQQLSTCLKERPLGTAVLSALLGALLELLELRSQLSVETVDLLLRCSHASVQLLLPRARAATLSASSWLLVAQQQWSALSWRTQLHVWPLVDRMRSIAPRCHSTTRDPTTPAESSAEAEGASGGASARASAGERLAAWLQHTLGLASVVEALVALVIAAATPGLPVRQTLLAMLSEERFKSAVSGDDVVTALAVGLAQGSAAEWQHATTQLLPILLAHNLLPSWPSPTTGKTPLPMPSTEADRRVVRAAYGLLVAMRVQRAAHADQGEAPNVVQQQQLLTFSTGFAKWLSTAALEVAEPLAIAYVLGIALRASAMGPDATAERYLMVRLQVQHRLLELVNSASTPNMTPIGHVDDPDRADLSKDIARVEQLLRSLPQ